nr:cytochrome c554 family protein [Spirochaetota bacterium]
IGPSAIIYNTVFGDGNGRPVMNVAKARLILKDRRIGPMQSVSESYRLPVIRVRPVAAEVKLWYRIAPQELVDSVLGKGKLKIPAVLMASDKTTLTVK